MLYKTDWWWDLRTWSHKTQWNGALNVNLLVHILIVCASWGLIKALLFALTFVLYPVAQISIYKPMLGFKKLLKLGFFTDSCCKPSGKSFVCPSWSLVFVLIFPIFFNIPSPKTDCTWVSADGFTYSGSESGVSGREHTALSLSAWLLVWNAFCMCWLSSDWSWGRWIEPRRIMESKYFNNNNIYFNINIYYLYLYNYNCYKHGKWYHFLLYT